MHNAYSRELFSVNFIVFVARRCKANLLAVKPLLIWGRTVYDAELESLQFLLDDRNVAVNVTVSDKAFVRGNIIDMHYEK